MKTNKKILILIQIIFLFVLVVYSNNSLCLFTVEQHDNIYNITSNSNTQIIDFKPLSENGSISGNIKDLEDCSNLGGKEGKPFCIILFLIDDLHACEKGTPVRVVIIYKNPGANDQFKEIVDLKYASGSNVLQTFINAGLSAASIALPCNDYADDFFKDLGGEITGPIVQGIGAGFSYLFFDTIIANIPKPEKGMYNNLLKIFEPFITHAMLGMIKCFSWAKDQNHVFHPALYGYCIIASSSAGGIASNIANLIANPASGDAMDFIRNYGVAAIIRVGIKGLTGVYPGGTTDQSVEISQDIISAWVYQEVNFTLSYVRSDLKKFFAQE